MNRSANHQSGVALVTAILIVALASILSASLLKRLNLDISRTQNIIQNEQAYLYTLGLEIIAFSFLRHDAEDNKHDSLDEYWAFELPPFPVEGGQVAGGLKDLQGKFNLNNLSKTINAKNYQNDLQRFQRLLVELELNSQLANGIVDWLDTDSETTIPGGAEDDYYFGLEKAYRTANTLLVSPSELRQIRGFEDEKTYDALIDHVTALPVATSININIASKEVLKSLSTELKDEDIDKILDRVAVDPEGKSKSEPFKDISEFETFMKQNSGKQNFKAKNMVVSTDYFLLTAMAEIARGRVTLYSIIHRSNKGDIRVISRSQGVW